VGDVRDAFDESVEAATHLTPVDAGAIAAARALADKIDAWDVIVDWALDDLADEPRPGGRPAVPANDNTSLPTFLKYCESLGLTPTARAKASKPKGATAGGSRLAVLQGEARGARSA
jgi:hypothetical protein